MAFNLRKAFLIATISCATSATCFAVDAATQDDKMKSARDWNAFAAFSYAASAGVIGTAFSSKPKK
jgi:hypothetical protein